MSFGTFSRAIRDRLLRQHKSNIVLEYNRHRDSLTLRDFGSHQSRNAATLHLFIESIKTIRHDLDSFRVLVQTGDQPAEGLSEHHFSYSKRRGQSHITAIPDFIFWYWPEAGIHDYRVVVGDLLRASELPPVDNRLFWVGNSATHPTRQRLVEIGAPRKDMLIEDVRWVPGSQPAGRARDAEMKVETNNYFSLPEHCKFRYLIDLQGVGYSGRLKLLLFSKRVVFVQERPWEEFFYERLVPFEHYIPVSESLEDLDEKLDWARAHQPECDSIASAAQNFALKFLTRPAAVDYQRQLLLRRFGRS
jgi:hypothetical protein